LPSGPGNPVPAILQIASDREVGEQARLLEDIAYRLQVGAGSVLRPACMWSNSAILFL